MTVTASDGRTRVAEIEDGLLRPDSSPEHYCSNCIGMHRKTNSREGIMRRAMNEPLCRHAAMPIACTLARDTLVLGDTLPGTPLCPHILDEMLPPSFPEVLHLSLAFRATLRIRAGLPEHVAGGPSLAATPSRLRRDNCETHQGGACGQAAAGRRGDYDCDIRNERGIEKRSGWNNSLAAVR